VLGVEIAARRRTKNIEPAHMEGTAQRLQFPAMQLDIFDHIDCAPSPATDPTATPPAPDWMMRGAQLVIACRGIHAARR
jgi:hypothetical protein